MLKRDGFMLPDSVVEGVNLSGMTPREVKSLAAAKEAEANAKLRNNFYPEVMALGKVVGVTPAGGEAMRGDAARMPIFDGCLFQQSCMALVRESLDVRPPDAPSLRERALDALNDKCRGVHGALLKPLKPAIAAAAEGFAQAARASPAGNDVDLALRFAGVAQRHAADANSKLSLPEELRQAYRELRARA